VAALAVTMLPSGGTPALRLAAAVSAADGHAALPARYVAIAANGNPNIVPSYAVVRATLSGESLATIEPSVAHGTIVAVTAAADDRTFVLDEQPWVGNDTPGQNQFTESRTFYLLRLNSAGGVASLTRLAAAAEPAGALVTGLALSPDGKQLAVAVEPQNVKSEPMLQEVRLYNLAAGTWSKRTWYGDGTIGTGPDDAKSMSWTANERTLAIDWYGSGPTDGVRLLSLNAHGSSLLGDSRLVVSAATLSGSQKALACQEDDVVAPDGSVVACGAVLVSNAAKRDITFGFLEFSTATGKIIGTVDRTRLDNAGPLSVDVFWTDDSGSALIGVTPEHGGEVGMIRGDKFTPLPWSSKLNSFGTAW
jgi:hypothetical protein